jgi:hypothetical protein
MLQNISTSINEHNVTCPSYTDGSAKVSASGGTTGYEYLWTWKTNTNTTDSISGLDSGTFYLEVSDSNGCIVYDTAYIVKPAPFTAPSVITPVSCMGLSDGEIDITTSGGTTPYSYNWSNSETTEDITGLTAGEYRVTITDNNSCWTVFIDTVTQPAALQITYSVDSTICARSEGTITPIVTGGTLPYLFNWSTSSSDSVITGLAMGNYHLTVEDANHCKDSVSITMPSIVPIVPEICMVRIDAEDTKNMIVWERKAGYGTAYYKVYKEISTNVYDSIGMVLFNDTSSFIDMASKPKEQAEKYKISSVDSCGVESGLSPYHQTMNLSIASGKGTSNIILVWNKYIDESGNYVPANYHIYRGFDSTLLSFDRSITGGLSSYNINITDAQVHEYYQVRIERGYSCAPASLLKASAGPYSQSLSNLEDNRLKGSDIVEQTGALANLKVYPVPFNDKVNIIFTLNNEANVQLSISNAQGMVLDILENRKLAPGQYSKVWNDAVEAGMYFLKIEVDGKVEVRKLVKQ